MKTLSSRTGWEPAGPMSTHDHLRLHVASQGGPLLASTQKSEQVRRAWDTRRPSVAVRVSMARRSCAVPHTAQPREGPSGGMVVSSRLLLWCSSTYVTCAPQTAASNPW